MLPNYKNIESIAIHSLFNLYTHDVSLNSEGITIVHGKNDVGKIAIAEYQTLFSPLKSKGYS